MDLPVINEKSHEKIMNSLRKRLELRGASQRKLHCPPRNYDRAVEEMNLMQKSFDKEREDLIAKLHCSLKEISPKEKFKIRSKTVKSQSQKREKIWKEFVTQSKYLKSPRYLKKVYRGLTDRSQSTIANRNEIRNMNDSVLTCSPHQPGGLSPWPDSRSISPVRSRESPNKYRSSSHLKQRYFMISESKSSPKHITAANASNPNTNCSSPQLVHINEIISSCLEFNHFETPKVPKSSSKGLKPNEEVKILVKAINKYEESSLENELEQLPISEHINREKAMRKEAMKNLYDTKSLEKLKKDRWDTSYFVGCKLRSKRVWKYKGDILPKKFQNEIISNYMNSKFL
ncbi:unnamed protein product [Blepharisma stoltei]|uniref:Uncharacterized protein n=1 Tax=Blepharisma stoltei TaxID=1481888 RepID=A0AAU9I9Y9_9CILI|nr:unnamed protein product [Blepharisma stoltei]